MYKFVKGDIAYLKIVKNAIKKDNDMLLMHITVNQLTFFYLEHMSDCLFDYLSIFTACKMLLSFFEKPLQTIDFTEFLRFVQNYLFKADDGN